MSDIIKLLPDSVANQIAAGEVIQRPSSVIKELVENSIDAGASHIQIVVVDAGKSCIQVIDDGKGMSETDARLAFERHATSKISDAADLYSLHTMGFRGEALASIAAVAQVELKTRTADKEVGICLQIEGSKVVDQMPASCPVGANFAVKNLFFNIPARRKFLKSNQTEMSNIFTEFERVSLAHPDIAFTLYSGDSVLLNLPAGNFRQRIIGVFGKKIDTQLLPISVDTSLAKISGFVGTPESSKKKGAHQYFFVNGRFMRHPYFSKAVMAAYERLIPDSEQVPFFINFEVDPSRIDVNIHPAKTEIKFQDDQALWQILLAAVRESLGKFNAVPTLDFDTENCPQIPAFNPNSGQIRPPQVHVDNKFNPFENTSSGNIGGTPSFPNSKRWTGKDMAAWQQMYETALGTSGQPLPQIDAPVESPSLYENLPEEEKAVWEKSEIVTFQFQGRYIVASTPSGLVIVDQHRAHTRLLYDMYLQQLSNHKGITQGLLFPQILQMPLSSATVFEPLLPHLANVGFDISPLGGGSYSVLGIPAGTEGLDAVQLLQSILDDALMGKPEAAEAVNQLIARVVSRQAAMPVGQALSAEEMVDLVERLNKSSNPNYTPDGKNIMYVLDADRIERMFDN